MANKYSYIAYIEGDTSGIVKAMKDVEEQSKDLTRRMKVINEGLKFNPESVELLGSKFDTLSEQVENAKVKFEALKSVEEQAKHSRETGVTTKDQYAKYIQELTKAENNYKMLEIAASTAKTQLDNVKEALKQTAFSTEGLGGKLSEIDKISKSFDSELKEIDSSLRNNGGVEILEQKYDILSQAIENTKNRLNELNSAQKNMSSGLENGTISVKEQREYQREIEGTQNKLLRYENELEQVRQKLDNTATATDETEKETKELGNAIEDAGEQTVTFGDILKANILSDYIQKGISKLANSFWGFMQKGVTLASDLQEVQNVVDTTFGDGAAQIYKWADAAAESFGMSSLQAQNFNGTLGAMLKSMGLTDDAVRTMSMDMVGLAGDMASFYNLDVETAFEKIRSGISGETEPLKQLGINMSVANLEAYALAQGIETAYDKMSQSEQAILRYNYLMAQTADAQGDFAKTSDSFANQQRILKLQTQNLAASLGEKLLPSLNNILQTANDKLPKLENTAENIGEIIGNITEFALENHEAILSLITAYGTFYGVMKAGNAINTAVTAIKSLTTATKAAETAQHGMNAAAAANPYVLLASAVAAVTVGLISLASAAGEASKELKETAEESIKAYEEQTEKVAGLEKELDDVNKKIEEIQNKGKLNLTDEEELSRLQVQNDKLSTQLEIEKEILETKRQQAEVDLYNAVMSEDSTKEGTIANIEWLIKEYENNLSYIETYQDKLKKALADGNETLAEDYRQTIANFEQGARENKLKILEETDSLNDLAENLDHTTEIGKETSTAIDELNQIIAGMFNLSIENPVEKQIEAQENYSDYMQREGERRLAEMQEQNAQELADYEENLKAKLAELDDNFALRRIYEEDYYNQLGSHLEENRNLESKEYFSALEKYENYLEKKQAAAEKAAEEEQKAEKERQDAVQKATEEAETERVNAIKASWDKITKMRDFDKIGDEEEYKLKAQLVKDYCNENEEIWDSYYKWLYDYTKSQEQEIADERLKAWEDSSKELADKLSEAYSDLKSQKEQVKKDLQSIDLTETVTDKDGNDVLVLKDLDAEIKKIDKYEASLEKLKSTGISESLMSAINNLSYADGSRQAYIDELLVLSADKLQLYYDDWERLQERQEEAAQNSISDKLDEVNESAAESVSDIFGKMPETAYEEGVKTAQSYLQGIIDSMDSVNDLNAISGVLNSAYNYAAAPSYAGESGGSGSARAVSVISVDTPININLNDKEYISTTIGKLISKGQVTGGNVFNL